MPGTYRFKWPHAADEVIVTGTFDNWAHNIKLDKKAWAHEKTVDIPDTNEEILYKFVVNGQWRTDPSHAVKRDHEGNENNVLDPEDIIPSHTGGSGGSVAAVAAGAGAATIATVGAGATTLGLAGQQPLEDKSMPGAFPETPMESGNVPTLQDQVVGVKPIPATSGIGNPVQLQPGEKVPDPSTLTGNTVASTATTDKASYEAGANGAAYASAGKVDDSAAHFGRPQAGGKVIPESGLPMGDGSNAGLAQKDVTDPQLASVGTNASTVGLAGKQPIEPRGTPTVEKKNDGVAEKAAAGVAVAGVAAAGAAVAANEVIKDKTGKDPVSALPQSAQDTIHQNAKDSNLPAQATGADRQTTSSVPQEVTESQKAAHQAPEAAANATAVQEKSQAEKELLSKVQENNARGDPAPTAGAVSATSAPTGAERDVATGVPQEVTESQKEAGQSPEAAANATAVHEKSDVEKELLAKVPENNAHGEPAPTAAAVSATTVPTTTSQTGAPQLGKPTAVGMAPISMDEKPSDANVAALKASSMPAQGPRVAADGASNPSTPQKRHSLVDRLKTPKSEAGSSEPSTPTSKKRQSFMKRMKEKLKNL